LDAPSDDWFLEAMPLVTIVQATVSDIRRSAAEVFRPAAESMLKQTPYYPCPFDLPSA
jgi:hypothetical protein